MKNKIYCILFLVFFLLSSCSQTYGTYSTDYNSTLDYNGLFDISETSISTSSVNLGDGNWIFKKIYVGKSHQPIESTYTLGNDSLTYAFLSLKIVDIQELTVTGGYIITTSQKHKSETEMDSQNKQRYDSFAKAHGKNITWNGNTLITEYSSSYETLNNLWVTDALNLAEASYGIAKKNSSGTKYFVTYRNGDNDNYYFEKIN
ncbi:MAG: hypothetical protein IK024_09410 [Treponema sp.]|nr:hypothetical protein [Treponema sp.]